MIFKFNTDCVHNFSLEFISSLLIDFVHYILCSSSCTENLKPGSWGFLPFWHISFGTLTFIQQQCLLSNICKIFFFPGDQLWGAHTSPYGCTRAGPADILPLLSWGETVPSHHIATSLPGLTLKRDVKSFSERLFHLLQSLGAELTALLSSRIGDASALQEFTACYCFSISNCISSLSVCRDLLLLPLPASSYAPQGPAALLSQSIIDHGH